MFFKWFFDSVPCLTPPRTDRTKNTGNKTRNSGKKKTSGKGRCPWELQAWKIFEGWQRETMNSQKVENEKTEHVEENKVFSINAHILNDSKKAASTNVVGIGYWSSTCVFIVMLKTEAPFKHPSLPVKNYSCHWFKYNLCLHSHSKALSNCNNYVGTKGGRRVTVSVQQEGD